MKIAVSPSNGLTIPSSPVALSSKRRLVVPTAMIRPPAARAMLRRSAVAASIRPHSACMAWSAVASALIGGKVDPVALAQPLGVTHESLPAAQVHPLVQRRADPRFAAPAFELGGDDPRIVEHQDVAAVQQAG